MIEEKEDFFERVPEEKPKKVKPPKEPRLRPDDPLYYEREEGKWEHLLPGPRRGRYLVFLGLSLVAAIMILCWGYIYFFTPEVSEAEEYGYVEDIHREGKLFTTYEGVILPYKNLKDARRDYEKDFVFSTNEHIASELRRRQHSGVPVRVHYEVYRQRFPWRGASKTIVTGFDTLSNEEVKKILPPELAPQHP